MSIDWYTAAAHDTEYARRDEQPDYDDYCCLHCEHDDYPEEEEEEEQPQ
jgi:hypothetical protein